jgi:hypothetical protein
VCLPINEGLALYVAQFRLQLSVPMALLTKLLNMVALLMKLLNMVALLMKLLNMVALLPLPLLRKLLVVEALPRDGRLSVNAGQAMIAMPL